MAEISLIASSLGLMPYDEPSKEWFAKLKMGTRLVAKISAPRNPKFHAKFFAMLNLAYENHDWPLIQTQHGDAQCTFEQFREYVTIKAGYFEMGATPKGDPRAVAKSISFAKMDEAEFQDLYSRVLDVILREFLENWKHDDMEQAVNAVLGFA